MSDQESAKNKPQSLADSEVDGMLQSVTQEAFGAHPFEQFIKLSSQLARVHLIHTSTNNEMICQARYASVHADGKVHSLTWSEGQGNEHRAMTIDVQPASKNDPLPFTTALHQLMLDVDRHYNIKHQK